MRLEVLFVALAMICIGCSCSKTNDTSIQKGEGVQRAATSSDLQGQDFKIEATNSAASNSPQRAMAHGAIVRSQPQVTLPSESLVIHDNAVSTDEVGHLIRS